MEARNLNLFENEDTSPKSSINAPLADLLRPKSWDSILGLYSIDQLIIKQLRAGQGKPPSLVFWGPPGSGKTTIARQIGRTFHCAFVELSAVLAGVKEIREVALSARQRQIPTVLFVDEIHRLNRSQQDAFLPHVEDGTFALLGATTENPSFYLTNALRSRLRIVVLKPLDYESLRIIALSALGHLKFQIEEEALRLICESSAGDARVLINLLESIFTSGVFDSQGEPLSVGKLKEFIGINGANFYDRSGDEHYNMASAFIKSMRGSDPDAALYWGFRMIESGEDPRFILRRMIIFASEDIGNADPKALPLAVAASEAYEKIGLPEGKIPIAQCITYLSCAPKSNRSYVAMREVINAIQKSPKAEVPLHLRNAPTLLMKQLGYGKDYQYPHDEPGAVAQAVNYLPDQVRGNVFYEPSDRGYERAFQEQLQKLRASRGS